MKTEKIETALRLNFLHPTAFRPAEQSRQHCERKAALLKIGLSCHFCLRKKEGYYSDIYFWLPIVTKSGYSIWRDVGVSSILHVYCDRRRMWRSYDVMTAVIIVGIVKSFPFHSLMFVLNLAFAPFKSFFPWIWQLVSTKTFCLHRCTRITQLSYHRTSNQNAFFWHVIGRVQLRGAWRGRGLEVATKWRLRPRWKCLPGFNEGLQIILTSYWTTWCWN